MKYTILIIIALTISLWAIFGGRVVDTQNLEKSESDALLFRGYSRDLEGSWNAEFTVRNCQTGDALTTFPALNTFERDGTLQHDSGAVNPQTRSSGHGVWKHEMRRSFSFAIQFLRFNNDGTYAGRTVARRQAELNQSGSSYAADVTLEIYNPAGVLVGTGCATETATRFE
jgi:hypothetical protein